MREKRYPVRIFSGHAAKNLGCKNEFRSHLDEMQGDQPYNENALPDRCDIPVISAENCDGTIPNLIFNTFGVYS
jgi:hypothetical protein